MLTQRFAIQPLSSITNPPQNTAIVFGMKTLPIDKRQKDPLLRLVTILAQSHPDGCKNNLPFFKRVHIAIFVVSLSKLYTAPYLLI